MYNQNQHGKIAPVGVPANKTNSVVLTSPGAKAIKLLLLFHELIIMMFAGGILLGIGAWIATDSLIVNDVCTIFGFYYHIALYSLLIIVGAVMVVISFVGIFGTKNENACLMLLYQIVVISLFLICLVIGIVGFIFYQELQTVAKGKMELALTKSYGIMQDLERYKEVTQAYDNLQKKFECCGVSGSLNSTKSWYLYRNASAWYQVTAIDQGNDYPYVPNSCCKFRSDQILSQSKCTGQSPLDNKPPVAGPEQATSSSDYMNEQGCYDAMKSYVSDVILKVAAIGIVYMILLFLGIIITFMLLRMIAVSQYGDNKYSPFHQDLASPVHS